MSKFDSVAHYLDYDQLVEIMKKDQNDFDFEKIDKAYHFALKSHGDQRRVSGVPYILHPTSVACILVELGMDTDSICAALLHDVVEDTPVTLEEIIKVFDKEVGALIDGVTKLSKIPYSNREEQQAENLRKMLMAMSNDIRVIIIKLADRLHNMRTIECMDEQKRRDKALENMEIFAPIAHRLGIKAVKDELEDLSIRYLDPIGYEEIEQELMFAEDERDRYIEGIREKILKKTEGLIPNVYISGRVKSINSIYRKTFMQGKTINQIFDIFAVRVIVDTTNDCYNVLGVIHDIFRPLPNRFKDYISTPKPNMYQSLHTTVFDKDGIPFEVQIRTWEMQYTAEYGIAAHWKYKLGISKGKNSIEQNLKDIKQLIQNQLETEDSTDIIRNIKNDFAQNNVYVFTPKGDVKNLPQGATVIDMAYSIHSGVGNRMIGAKVDGRIVPIDYQVNNGEIVEILTQKEGQGGPKRDWLQIVKTSEARSKIRTWFKKERREENILEGKEELDRQLKHNGIHLAEEEKEEFFAKIMAKNHCKTMDDFYASIGYGGIHIQNIMHRIKEEYQKQYLPHAEQTPPIPEAQSRRKKVGSGVVVADMEDCLVKFSKCCSPLPGDSIIGFITRGHGVSIHKKSCPNVPQDISVCDEPERWIDVAWEGEVKESFNSTLEIIANDRTGFLADVAVQLTGMHIFIHALNSREIENNQALITITIEVNGIDHLKGIMTKLSNVNGVISIRRI